MGHKLPALLHSGEGNGAGVESPKLLLLCQNCF